MVTVSYALSVFAYVVTPRSRVKVARQSFRLSVRLDQPKDEITKGEADPPGGVQLTFAAPLVVSADASNASISVEVQSGYSTS
jgi:hypothetical protein